MSLPRHRETGRRRRGAAIGCFLFLAVAAAVGCDSMRFYRQAARGQWELITRQVPIERVLENSTTAPATQQKLALVLDLRQYAADELRLSVDGDYLKYADLRRPYVVWNVHAAPEFSVAPKRWWYPIVGRLKYRGYFLEAAAKRYADRLAAAGWDVYVEGVEAYSTLGWFKDPVLNTFLSHDDAALAEILFHELAHQRLFVRSDTDFNEAFATAVAEEGVRRWLDATGRDAAPYRQALARQRQIVRLVLETRGDLQRLFGGPDTDQASADSNFPPDSESLAKRRAQKSALFGELQRQYNELKDAWGGYSGYDGWFAESLNNAKLNTVATYYDLVPCFEELLAQNSGDRPRWYRAAEEIGNLGKDERRARLEALQSARRRSPN